MVVSLFTLHRLTHFHSACTHLTSFLAQSGLSLICQRSHLFHISLLVTVTLSTEWAVYEVGKGGQCRIWGCTGAGNVNKLQLPSILAVNRRIIVRETCGTVSRGWRCWRSWKGNGERLLEKLTFWSCKTLFQTLLLLYFSRLVTVFT